MPGGNATSATESETVDLSVVIPVYCNEGALTETVDSLISEVFEQQQGITAELIFVDDGSPDGSWDELLRIQKAHPDLVRLIKLTRNFGQPSARRAGLAHSRGRCTVSMSADGQDPCSLINEMLEAHREEGYEIVACARRGRDESWYRVLTSRVFYSMIRRLAFPQMPPGGFDYVMLGRRALDVILANAEAHPFFQGQVLWTGFKTKFLEYKRRERKIGRSRWTFGKKLTLLIDGVLSYSFLPIRLMSLAGMTAAFFGFAFALVVILRKIFVGAEVAGWTGIMVVLLVIGGLQMLMLGIVGEYVWRTLAQSRDRAAYVIELTKDKDDIE